MQAKTPTHPRRARSVFDYIDEIVRGYGPRVRVVQLWRRVDGARNVWTYLGRLAPEQCEIELIGKHFGGGEYRAKLLGLWDPQRRQEEYLEQVTFALCDRAWPITAETLARLREQQLK